MADYTQWQQGERDVFDYLLDAFGDTEDSTAFLGEYPPDFADETITHMWMFAFEGGGENDGFARKESHFAINGTARWDGVFTTRAEAQAYACQIMGLFPIDDSGENRYPRWNDLKLSTDPLIQRAVVRRNPDQTSTAGERRVWQVTVMFEKARLKI